ncbi:TrbG/VirB9 family P-type conjugative transfer protein [Phenylobacterium aquaticum]|uniref:TrbG/VirB9 family P-type conjugative transfer protein n=1 Tax=Phenylobacterium aquaticum TaxID=1763816 RepID=UPI001F5C4189|nr:TrbG/VirB9 family P-type conjugative transfer protein [Phenylobacterium aquaticum]MCI3135350.1 TrbG/VirB9 family P-type conjugative transfer protein [Phenylobacterium aquaticum]
MNRLLMAGLASLTLGAADRRIQTQIYDPAAVVRLEGAYRSALEVVFDPDETIAHAALGDTTAWDLVADRNVLFLKPKADHGPTNLIVTTDQSSGGSKTYVFALEISRRSDFHRQGLYVLKFRDPAKDQAKLQADLAARSAKLTQDLTALKLAHGPLEGPRNLDYLVQGPAELAPLEISDNGQFTLLRFRPDQPLPALYAVGADGVESLTAFDVRQDAMVAHAVAPQWRLRIGRQVVCLYNRGFGRLPPPPRTGAASTQVERQNRPAPEAAR